MADRFQPGVGSAAQRQAERLTRIRELYNHAQTAASCLLKAERELAPLVETGTTDDHHALRTVKTLTDRAERRLRAVQRLLPPLPEADPPPTISPGSR